METPEIIWSKIKRGMGQCGISAFLSAFVVGLLVHMPIMVSDIPNHDGLASMYYDQNMITSGRWFLTVACGISSYYALPWLIGVLSVVYLSFTAVCLVKTLKIQNTVTAGLIGGLIVTFPTLASNFAYMFTMDGYMLGLLLSVLAVYFVGRGKLGFIPGALALAFSMGIYQAYLPVTMLLALYLVLVEFGTEDRFGDKVRTAVQYVAMGAIGASLYYVILKLLLLIQGKELASYQGIEDMGSFSSNGIMDTLKQIYVDFAAFTIRGKVLFSNGFALTAFIILMLVCGVCFISQIVRKKLYKSVWLYILTIVCIVIIPVFTNIILIVSAGVTYHVLMRYQWVLFSVLALAYIDSSVSLPEGNALDRKKNLASWITLLTAFVLIFNYAITDNIAYSNLQKKYEKTYSYCLRLADRIEQTDGYYRGIPIYMIGVVGDDPYPVTDITQNVTDHLLGIGGDYLLYTGANYEMFFKYYMGISFNFIRPEEANYYYEDWYVEMPSFPAAGSVKVVDGILFVKTENSDRSKVE